MNVVLDTLASARSARWLGHLAGLACYLAFAAAGLAGELGWTAAVPMAAALLAVELVFGLFNRRARRLKRLAPTAFPFKKMEADDRAFLQDALAGLPDRGVARSLAAWLLAAAALWAWNLSWAGALLLLACGALPAALAQGLMTAAMLKRVLPFFFFEDRDGFAQGLSAWLPSLSQRFRFSLLLPLLVVLPALAAGALLQRPLGWGLLAAAAGVGLAFAFAGAAVLDSLVEQPLRELVEAQRAAKAGQLDALLDVTSADGVGQASEAHNRLLRAVDRRFFLLEKFGHTVLPGRSEGVLEGLRLDGETRPVAVLSVRWLDAAESLRGAEPRARLGALSRFYEAVQDAVDRHQGCSFQLDDGAVLAVWGAPFVEERAVQAALAAAWELQGLLPVLARQARQRDGLSLRWGLGLASGQATAGLAGPRGRERYSVHGGPVDEARALAARGEGCWVDERSAGAARAPFGVQVSGEGARLIDGPTAAAPAPEALGFRPGDRL